MEKETKVIYVYSGKGGVGKSTTAVNLAYSFALQGFKTGIFDADLYGPSIPTLVSGLDSVPYTMEGMTTVIPGEYNGVKINSVGFICNELEDIYFEGEYLRGALHQLLFSVEWDCDVLIVDLPPGTFDLHKELFSNMPGKVLLVTMPHKLSISDTIRSIHFLKRLNVEIIGIVENMSNAGDDPANSITVEDICRPFQLELLAQMPISAEISSFSNKGIPFVLNERKGDETNLYQALATACYNSYNRSYEKERMN